MLLGGGDPAYVEKMQALAAELGLGDSVIFAGVRSNIQSFYDAMDAFCCPAFSRVCPSCWWRRRPRVCPALWPTRWTAARRSATR
ncbi:hypothetical protein NIA69_08040 [Gemmiger formicilis]|nr:hypothetical protein [Gemmiger formicilis]